MVNYDPVLPLGQKASISVALQTRQIQEVIPATRQTEDVIPSTSKGKSTPGLAKKSSGLGLMPMPVSRPLFTPQKRSAPTDIITPSPANRGPLKFKFRRISPPTSSQPENYAMIQEPQEIAVNEDYLGKKIFKLPSPAKCHQ